MIILSQDNVRVTAVDADGRVFLEFAVQAADGWHLVLSSGMFAPPHMWTTVSERICEDPRIEWKETIEGAVQREGGFLRDAVLEGDRLLLTGRAGGHQVAVTVSIAGPGHCRVTVDDQPDESARDGLLGLLMSHLYFTPDGKAARAAEPLEFAWLPALHFTEQDVCADHFFRSPAVAVMALGYYAALLPDLHTFAAARPLPHALDLRVTGAALEAPRLSYGLCTLHRTGHVYTTHDPEEMAPTGSGTLSYAFDLLFGEAVSAGEVSRRVTSFIWDAYGRPTLHADIRPQVLPFAEYGRCYAYPNELRRTVREVEIDGAACAGINNPARRGANFHAWENDLHVAFGVKHYAKKWDDPVLERLADGILRLTLHAPRRDGAFPCIYNFAEGRYEGSLFWTARAADPIHGYDSAAMGVTAWWQLCWEALLDDQPGNMPAVEKYVDFLTRAQLPSGAIPTYFVADGTPAAQLRESATTAISGAVLARYARLSGDARTRQAALAAGAYVEREIIPGLLFNDFETYYSCSPKPLHAVDYWSGIRPHCNLSLHWACDHCLALYQLTGDAHWLQQGEYLLSILSLYQQAWNPSHFPEYLFGGFGVMNTDGEWNDGRACRFVSTYADYYQATGYGEYLERAIAACRAAFALLDIAENHANGINQLIMREGPGEGYAPENIHHLGLDGECMWTGMNWSAGGALAAAAYLERLFGSLLVDLTSQKVYPIDGVHAVLTGGGCDPWQLAVSSALAALLSPYRVPREVTVNFTGISESSYHININGNPHVYTQQELRDGITLII